MSESLLSLTFIISFNFYISLMRYLLLASSYLKDDKLSHSNDEKFFSGYIAASWWQSWDSNPGNLSPEVPSIPSYLLDS